MIRVCRLYSRVWHVSKRMNAAAAFIPKRIDTVPPDLHKYLFGTEPPETATTGTMEELLRHLPMAPLRGGIKDHFRELAEEKIGPYRTLLSEMEQLDMKKYRDLIPKEFVYEAGWTRYDHETGEVKKVSHPLEPSMVFDVEVCVVDGKLPTMATALTTKAWYSWCSPRLTLSTPFPSFATPDQLIPLLGPEANSSSGWAEPRVVIGHNVGYDRARCREPYMKQKTGIRFMDTMSMALPMYGMADHQRTLYAVTDLDEEPSTRPSWYTRDLEAEAEKKVARDAWSSTVSRMSLFELYKFLYGHERTQEVLKKTTRDKFVKENIEFFRDPEEFQECMLYCARDVAATTEVFQKILPTFYEMYPHPATLYGILSMGAAYLPINQYWPLFYAKNEKDTSMKKVQNVQNIVRCALELEEKLKETHSSDLWFWSEDWKPTKQDHTGWFTSLFKKSSSASIPVDQLSVSDVVGKSKLIPKIFGMLYGPYPLFCHEKYGWGFLVPKDGKSEDSCDVDFVKSGKKTLPLKKLRESINTFKLEYGEIPLEKDNKKGTVGACDYYQLPNDTKSTGVGTPFAKPYKNDIQQKVLRATRFEEHFEEFLGTQKATDFWEMYSERYGEELHVWYPEDCERNPLEMTMEQFKENTPKMVGALAPSIIPAGTVSRRSVHKLWVTMTNAKDSSRIGTHLKSMVQSPEGYCIVGADVDSQEQWLAALFGDASDAKGLDPSERRPGRTPFSNMSLVGQKSDGSDLHTVVARDLGINRDQAKTLNYARLYGSGRMHAETFLRKSGSRDAAEKSTKLFELTKGKEMSYRRLSDQAKPFFLQFCKEKKLKDGFLRISGEFYLPDYANKEGQIAYDFEEWICERVSEMRRDEKKETVEKEKIIPILYDEYTKTQKLYAGGYESSTFNFLVLACAEKNLRTPILGAQLGASLCSPEADEENGVTVRGAHLLGQSFKRSVMNWVVQSSAVDFLHLLLLSMDWLCKEYDIDARFVISIHDEVRFLCPLSDGPRCALALMLSNMYVRALISDTLGIPQLPMNIAFFSQVDKDVVLRKEVDTPCENPDGTVPEKGVAWDIRQILELTGGSLEKKK